MLNPSKYFRFSITSRCNLSCFFCHREGNLEHEIIELSPYEIETACRVAHDKGFQKFKITGGEPTLRDDICEIISRLTTLNLQDLSMITNGTMLSQCAKDLWDAGLRRINVTLNTLNSCRFHEIHNSKPSLLDDILRGIDIAYQTGFRNMKINFVYIDKTSRMDLNDVIKYAKDYKFTIVLLPVLSDKFFCTLDELYELVCSYGIESETIIEDNEGIRKRYVCLPDGTSIILRCDELGDCNPYVFCQTCQTHKKCREGIFPIRLSSNGCLIPCMANSHHQINIRNALSAQDFFLLNKAFDEISGWYV